MSDSDEDPHFRIPRGSSDEEIDCDIASGPPSPSPGLNNVDSVEDSHPSSSTDRESPSKLTPSRHLVAKNASALATGLTSFLPSDADDDELDSDSESDADNDLPASALANVTAAITNRDLTLDSARHVDPCNSSVPSTAPAPYSTSTAAAPTHSSMINHILETLQKTDSEKPIAPLQKKINRLHTEKATRLAVPLSEPLTARLERAAAYKHATEAITEKWTDTVIQHRRADHLSFPLNEPRKQARTTRDLVMKNKNYNVVDHEMEISDLLKEAGVEKDADVERGEKNAVDDALATGKVSKEDVIRRQRELARIRSLVFHYDKKMRRIKKIKSKKYRKEMKKDRERLEGKEVLDSEGEREEEVLAERRRIEERVTQRHKNTSKWVKRQLQRGEAKKDEVTRAAIEDQLRLHEELKRRQLKEVGSDSDSGDEGDTDMEEGEEEEIARLEKEIRGDGEEEGVGKKSKKKKGIMSLRFMQAAEERKRKEALALLKEMNDDGGDDDDDDDNSAGDKVVGRKHFSGTNESEGLKKYQNRKRAEGEDEDEDEDGNGDGLIEDSDDDDGNEAKILERRIRKEYDHAGEGSGIKGKGNGGRVDIETAAEVIKSQSTTAAFTTKLGGRLTADNEDDNPWLNGFGVSTGDDDEKNNAQKNEKKEILVKKKLNKEGDQGGIKRKRVDCDSNSVHTLKSSVDKGANFDGKTNVLPDVGEKDCPQEEVNNQGSKAKKRKKKKKKASSEVEAMEERGVECQSEIKGNADNGPSESNIGEHNGDEEVESRDQDGKGKLQRKKKNKKNNSGNIQEKVDLKLQEAEDKGNENHSDESSPSNANGTNIDSHRAVENGVAAADLERMEEIALAFAGAGGADLAEFEATKEAEVEKELPTAKSINAEVLPGWGTWDGAGINKKSKTKRKESPFIRAARERLEEARSNAVQSRSDRNMRNVILEQKRFDTSTKLTMASVPYPYQSREQWERELSRPLCRELVSGRAMKEGIRRKVDIKLGTVVDPIRTPVVSEKGFTDKTEEVSKRKNGKVGVIDLRKAKSKHRTSTRRGLMS